MSRAKGFFLVLIFLLTYKTSLQGNAFADDNDIHRIDSVVNYLQSIVTSVKPLVTEIDSITVLKAYYREGHILEIEIVTNAPILKKRCMYYIENGFLIKVLEKSYDLRDNNMTESVETTQYYFKGDKMICWLTNELDSIPRDKVYEKKERMWLNNIDKYFLMIQ